MKNKQSKFGFGIALSIVVLFIGVIVISNQGSSKPLRMADINKLSIDKKVLKLEQSLDEVDISYAAIYGDRLIYGNDDEEVVDELADDLFYLSFAPYINQTHPCDIHNLITCRAELVNQKFHVVVKDNDGKIIKQGNYKSYNNGFAGIWLPRDIEGTITVTYGKRSATAHITTYANSNTCLTTLELN